MFLEGAETALDFAFGLGCGSDQMGDAQSPPPGPEPAEGQGALELALGISVIVTGTGTKEAQPIGVNGQRNAVGFEGAAEMGEVVPGGLRGDETAGDVEAGVVIDGEQEKLFGRGRPPLVNGTVVLPEIADLRAAETPVGAEFSRWRDEEVGEVDFEASLDAGTRALEAAEPLHFIAHELKVGRILERQKAFEKSVDRLRPGPAVGTATGRWLEGFAIG